MAWYDPIQLFRMSILDSIRIIVVLSIVQTATSECYTPDKKVATDIPCQNSTFSACCSKDSYCLSNGYCMTDFMLSRRSCTDQSWKSSECPQRCQQTNPSDVAQIVPCLPDRWSCDLSTCHTSNFSLPDGSILPKDGQPIHTVTISAITTATTFDFPVTEIATVATFTTTITPITIATPITGPSVPVNEASQLRSITKLAVTGICIGIPLTMTIIALSLMLLLERQKSRSLTMEKSHLKATVLYHKELYAQSLKVPRDIGGGVPRADDGDATPRLRDTQISALSDLEGRC